MVISITRNSVMGIVEGLSVIIAQKNGGKPTFEELWASESERRKLDIYYREAIGDLERRVQNWLTSSTPQFSLDTDGNEDDYALSLTMHRYWPMRLSGLLGNKVQDFIVHSITAGWLNDFPDVTTKEDYSAIAATDLDDIVYILNQRDFSFDESSRSSDRTKPDGDGEATSEARATDTAKPAGSDSGTAEVRGTDEAKPAGTDSGTAEERETDEAKGDGSDSGTAEERGTDETKGDGTDSGTAEERATDEDKGDGTDSGTAEERTTDEAKGDGTDSGTAEERQTDTDKGTGSDSGTADYRQTDISKGENPGSSDADTRKRDSYKGEDGSDTPRGYKRKGDTVIKSRNTTSAQPAVEARHRDNAPVCITHDWTDWSGEDPSLEECMRQQGDPFGWMETRKNSLNPAYGRPVNNGNGDVRPNRRPNCGCRPQHRSTPQPYAHRVGYKEPGYDGLHEDPNPEHRYTPNTEKRWYEQLQDMSHQRGPEEHRGPDGIFMEKYREQHEQEAMQQHDCGRAMMTDVDI